jgi:signal transduction histidine kinase
MGETLHQGGMTALPDASILLVDDRAANLVTLEAALAPLQQRLVFAHSGLEALARAEEEEFALILMDVNMPGLDGFETVQQLRRTRHGSAVPVIFVTAVHDQYDYMARGYALGAVDYVTKPFEPKFLAAKAGWFVSLWRRGVLIGRQQELLVEREREAARAMAMREAAEAATRAKDEFLAMVSHDLLTPLTAMIGWAELLKKRLLDGEDAQKAIDTIFSCAIAQRHLIEDLLDISRIISGKLEVELADLDLMDVVKRVAQAMTPEARSRGIALVVSGEGESRVRGDERRLEQLVGNLLHNAIKFSTVGGHVSLSLASSETEQVLLEVRDGGAGIRPELLPHVFERYKQGAAAHRRSGLGLGLAIVRHIAELHGGTIEARSPGEGRGATFTLSLPRVRAGARAR